MWLGITELSKLLGVSTRTLQLSVQNSEVDARRRDARS